MRLISIVLRRVLTLGALLAVSLASACDLGKDAATTTEGGAESAAGIADKMSQGTVGGADEDSGESAGDADA
jgi:hypothetical protein